MRNIYTKYSTLGKQIKGFFGDQKARLEAQQDVNELNTFIVNNLNQNDIPAQIDPQTGDIVVQDDQGNTIPLDSSIWEDLKASKGEILGGVGAGIGAQQILSKAAAKSGTVPHPIQKAGVFLGTTVAGAAGAIFGRAEDITRNALETKEQIDNQLLWDQLQEAGAADMVFSTIGASLGTIGTVGIKTVAKAFDLLTQGNKQGAYTALKELMHLDDAQVDEIIKGWESLSGQKAPGLTRATKALEIIPRTTPGGEAIVSPAAALDPQASANAAKEIDLRAKQLLTQVDTQASGDMSTILRDELNQYKDTVKQVFTGAKEFASQEMKDSGYKFDYSKLAIDPIIERASKELTNPVLRERALNYLQRVRQLGGVTEEIVLEGETAKVLAKPELRTFDDLLELRRVVNEFGNSKLIKNAKDIDLLTSIRNRIDNEITSAAKTHMEQPQQWLDLWKTARTEYGKMFELEANVLYKQIMRKGTTDKTVAKQLMNKAMATDNTFRQVIEKLPPKMRALTESSVLQEFAEKFTIGEAGGMRATNFPALAKELQSIPFTTEKAQNIKRVVNEFASVFKNDIDLAKATGTVRTPQFQSYLTTDPVIRAKYEIASSVFNYIKRVLPGKKGQAIALVMKMSKVLENPRHVKSFKDMLKDLPADPTLQDTLKAAQLEIAKFGERTEFPKVPVYRRAAPGKTLSATEGPLGRGLYYETSKGKTGTSGTLSTKNILPTRIANEQNIAEILGVEKVTPKLIRENPQIQEFLQEKGFQGLTLGNQVLIFK